MGNKNNNQIIPLEETKRRDVGRVPDKNQQHGQGRKRVRMGLPLLCEKIAEGMWRAMEWACDEKNECGDRFPEECEKVEKYEMVAIHTRKNDERRSRKTAQDGRTSGGDTTEGMCGIRCLNFWASEKDWMTAGKERNSPEDRHKFITYILKQDEALH